MGGTISKAKYTDIKTLVTINRQHQNDLSPSSVRPETKPHNTPFIKSKFYKMKKRDSTSVRRREQHTKPRHRIKVTKSIISKPTNFKHTGHMGSGEVRSGQIDTEILSLHMLEIASRLGPTEYSRPKLTVRNKDASMERRAAIAAVTPRKKTAEPLSSFRSQRRQRRKQILSGTYRRKHHPTLAIDIPSLKSIIED